MIRILDFFLSRVLVGRNFCTSVPDTIYHLTAVLCSLTRPLNESEAGVDLALIQTLLLFLCKSCCCNVNEFLFTKQKQ